MTAEIWERVKSLYLEASEAPEGPAVFLRNLRGGDPEVLSLVRGLLRHGEETALGGEAGKGGESGVHGAGGASHRVRPGQALESGQVLLGRFEILGFLGAGGVGEVYRAFDLLRGVFVALKTLRPELASDPSSWRMLRTEFDTARLVKSPYVCSLHEACFPPSDSLRGEYTPPFFTMALLEGETLAHYLRHHPPFDPSAALPLADHMALALAAAHEQSVVHRDFKTANVMLTKGATRAVVMDFGLAGHTAETDADATFPGHAFAGTPAYMAPEQLRGVPATITSDIHSLGVVLFEMLTGHLPFESGNPIEIASRRLTEEAPSPRRYVPGLDPRWEYAILRCLEYDPKRRPASAADVLELLRREPPVMWRCRRKLRSAIAAVPRLARGGLAHA